MPFTVKTEKLTPAIASFLSEALRRQICIFYLIVMIYIILPLIHLTHQSMMV